MRLRPAFAEAQDLLGVALVNDGRVEESVTHFQAAVALGYTPALENLRRLQAALEAAEAEAPSFRGPSAVRAAPFSPGDGPVVPVPPPRPFRVPKTIVVIPTYNEKDNVPRLLPQVLAQAPGLEVLVVDDQSPDGTGALVEELGRQDPRVHLLSRPSREGLGPAYKDGFAWALAHGADLVVQMDADFSHAPEMIPRFLEKIQGCDLVLGSRYLKGITVVDWPIERLLLSYFGNWYVRRVTGLPMRDTTGGFKCWRRSALEAVNVAGVRSNGYAFQIEMTYRAWRRGLRIQEIPIIFMDRTVGDSKMTKRISLEALWIAWYLRAAHLFGRL